MDTSAFSIALNINSSSINLHTGMFVSPLIPSRSWWDWRCGNFVEAWSLKWGTGIRQNSLASLSPKEPLVGDIGSYTYLHGARKSFTNLKVGAGVLTERQLIFRPQFPGWQIPRDFSVQSGKDRVYGKEGCQSVRCNVIDSALQSTELIFVIWRSGVIPGPIWKLVTIWLLLFLSALLQYTFQSRKQQKTLI